MSTEYTKTNWQDGDIITADKMNNIENGIKGIEDVTTTVKDGLTAVHDDLIDVTELQTNNLLSGVVWEMGSIDLNTGNNMSSNTRIRTADYIDVSNIDSIDFSVNSGYMFVVDFFASDKSVLKVSIHGSWKSTAQRVIIPANVVYIRMLVSNSNSTAADVSYSGEVFATYYSHVTKIVNNSFDNLNGLIGGGSGTGNASATKVYSYASYCLNASGKLTAMGSTDNTYLVDKYEVQEGKAYAITGCALANYAVCSFIDKDNNILSYYSCPQYQGNWSAWFIWKNQIVVAPKNAIYLYVAFRNSVVTQGKAEIVTPLGYPKRWTNVKWSCMGDSLTELNNRANKHYYNYISDDTGINFVVLGKSGTGYMKAYGSNLPFSQRIDTIPTDSNVITIFGSGNDVGQTLGNVTDTGTNTICGCINNTIDGIRSRITGANLGIITPTPWEPYPPSTVGNAMDLYVDAIVEICRRKGVPCLDLYHCSNMTPWDADFKTAYYSHDDGNGTHPDENGQKLFAPRIKAFLESLLM